MKKIIIALFCCVALVGCNKSSNNIDVKCRWVIYNTGQFWNNNSETRQIQISPGILKDNPSFPEGEEIWFTSYQDTVFDQGNISFDVFPPISNPIIVEYEIEIPSQDFDLYSMGHYDNGSSWGWSYSSWSSDNFDHFNEKTYVEQNNQRIYTDTIVVGI